MTPAISAVTAATEANDREPPVTSTPGPFPVSMLVRMIGFRMTMYAIVKNVVRPPRSSRARVERRALISK